MSKNNSTEQLRTSCVHMVCMLVGGVRKQNNYGTHARRRCQKTEQLRTHMHVAVSKNNKTTTNETAEPLKKTNNDLCKISEELFY